MAISKPQELYLHYFEARLSLDQLITSILPTTFPCLIVPLSDACSFEFPAGNQESPGPVDRRSPRIRKEAAHLCFIAFIYYLYYALRISQVWKRMAADKHFVSEGQPRQIKDKMALAILYTLLVSRLYISSSSHPSLHGSLFL
jgi:hypothetical protein